MTIELKPGVRYRTPAVFGPAPGPRQKADGTPWTEAETMGMRARWLTVMYRADAAKLEALLPPGFELRGDTVAASFSEFKDLWWLAGRGYGIVNVDFPVTFKGKKETIQGHFVPCMWEGLPDAILTGREELGFPKLFADIPDFVVDDSKTAISGEASWMGHKFVEFKVEGLTEIFNTEKTLPGNGGPALFYKYQPRTSIFGREGADVSVVTTSYPPPGEAINAAPIRLDKFDYRKWTGTGTVAWHHATFQQLPTMFHVVNGIADLEPLEFLGVEMVEFTGPGIDVSANRMRTVQTIEAPMSGERY